MFSVALRGLSMVWKNNPDDILRVISAQASPFNFLTKCLCCKKWEFGGRKCHTSITWDGCVEAGKITMLTTSCHQDSCMITELVVSQLKYCMHRQYNIISIQCGFDWTWYYNIFGVCEASILCFILTFIVSYWRFQKNRFPSRNCHLEVGGTALYKLDFTFFQITQQ